MANSGARTRAVAAEVVDAVVSGGQSLDAAIAEREERVAPADRSLLRMLCFGTVRKHWQLQHWINQLFSRPLKKRDSVINALLAIDGKKAEPPEHPMSADRVRWEHIQRIYELCGRNVSETARRLNMHRRTLQRILAKRAPK